MSTVTPSGESDGLPTSPILSRYITSREDQVQELLGVIETLRQDEDRLRHELGQQIRRRDQLRDGLRGSGPARLPGGAVTAAEDGVRRLEDELAQVRARLAESERERDRLRRELEDLTAINAEITDTELLHFERAEFERRRYERSEATALQLQAQVHALEVALERLETELASAQAVKSVSGPGPWWRRLFG